MQSSAGDKQRLLHIRDAINETEGFTSGLTADAFFASSLIKSGTVFQLQIIGESSNYVSAELKNQHPAIEWKKMTGLRNIIVHMYWGLDYVQVWNIVKNDLPDLKESIEIILAEL